MLKLSERTTSAVFLSCKAGGGRGVLIMYKEPRRSKFPQWEFKIWKKGTCSLAVYDVL